MQIRKAVSTDVNQLVGLISDFYTEVPYAAPLIDIDRCSGAVGALISQQGQGNADSFVYVMEKQGHQLHGMIIAERVQDIWTNAKVICEYFIYVHPIWRSGPAAGRMLLTFRQWAESEPALVRVQASSGIDDQSVGDMYAKLGWEPRGQIYGLEVT